MNNDILPSLIDGYHQLIKDRYQYDPIKSKYVLPDSVSPDKIDHIRDFFLENIYPTSEKRKILEKSFYSLDHHLKHPGHILKMLMDARGGLLHLGWQFPKAMKIAFKTLKSFRSASRLEKMLVESANQNNLYPPYDTNKVKKLISTIPRNQIYSFIDEGMILFKTLYDRPLVKKILLAIEHVISVMEKKKNFYSQGEIEGMQLGLKVLQDGNTLFDSLDSNEQKVIFQLIRKVETDAAEQIMIEYSK